MSEVGIIGQTYEDRRTKKQGKLLERDEKFKTLLMQSHDGKSFNISYGSFKSNWRSCEEPEETIEESLTEVEVPEEIPEVVTEVIEPVKQERKKQAERQVSSGYEEVTLKVIEYAESFNDVKVSSGAVPNKRRVTIKVDNQRIFVLTYKVRKGNYCICVNEGLFKRIKDNEYVHTAKYNDNWQSMKYSFIVEPDSFNQFLDDVNPYIIDCICGNKEE